MSTQKEDGSWPQNMWLEGVAHWKGLQIDQVAFPILLVERCIRNKTMDAKRLEKILAGYKKSNCIFNAKRALIPSKTDGKKRKVIQHLLLPLASQAMLAGADIAEINNENRIGKILPGNGR